MSKNNKNNLNMTNKNLKLLHIISASDAGFFLMLCFLAMSSEDGSSRKFFNSSLSGTREMTENFLF